MMSTSFQFSENGLHYMVFNELRMVLEFDKNTIDLDWWNKKLLQQHSSSSLSLFLVASVARHINDIDTEARAIEQLRLLENRTYENLLESYIHDININVLYRIFKERNETNLKEFLSDSAELHQTSIPFKV